LSTTSLPKVKYRLWLLAFLGSIGRCLTT